MRPMRSLFIPRAAVLVAALLAVGCGNKAGGSASASAESKSGAKPAEATFTIHWPAAGDKATTTTTEDRETHNDLNVGGENAKFDESVHESAEKIEECVEAGDKICKKMKVTFTKWERSTTKSGKESKEDGPTLNRVYIVEEKDGARTIVAEDGNELSDAEKGALNSYTRPRKGKAFLEALPTDKPVKVGDSLDALSKAMVDELARDPDSDQLKPTAKIVVKDIKDKIVVLELTLTTDQSDAMATIKGELKGTFEVRTDGGVPVRADLAGPITAELTKNAGTIRTTLKTSTVSTHSW